MKKHFSCSAVHEKYPLMLQFVEECIEGLVDGKEKSFILLSVEEILVNIIDYAYVGATGSVDIDFEYSEADREIQFTFIDEGPKFNPIEHDLPDLDAPIHERRIGGLGIMLVLKIMDKVEYSSDGNKNILTVRKRINTSSS